MKVYSAGRHRDEATSRREPGVDDILLTRQDGAPLLSQGENSGTVIAAIFEDPAFEAEAERVLAAADPAPASWGEVIDLLRAHILAEFESKGPALPYDPMAQVQALGLFAQRIAFNINAYRRDLGLNHPSRQTGTAMRPA